LKGRSRKGRSFFRVRKFAELFSAYRKNNAIENLIFSLLFLVCYSTWPLFSQQKLFFLYTDTQRTIENHPRTKYLLKQPSLIMQSNIHTNMQEEGEKSLTLTLLTSTAGGSLFSSVPPACLYFSFHVPLVPVESTECKPS